MVRYKKSTKRRTNQRTQGGSNPTAKRLLQYIQIF